MRNCASRSDETERVLSLTKAIRRIVSPIDNSRREARVLFRPERRRQRVQDWGRDGYVARFGKEWSAFLPVAERWLKVTRSSGREAIERIYLDTLNGKVAPGCGNILSL